MAPAGRKPTTPSPLSEAADVCISQGFWIDRGEVTYEMFLRFVDAGGYQKQDYWTERGWAWLQENQGAINTKLAGFRKLYGRMPAVLLSWYEASAYAHWRGGRLPTFEEWQYAAGGGSPGRRVTQAYPWGPEFNEFKANMGGKRQGADSTGSTFDAQGGFMNLYDIIGNVAEWTTAANDIGDRRGPLASDKRLAAGGHWASPKETTVATPQEFTVTTSDSHIGLRVIVPLGNSTPCS